MVYDIQILKNHSKNKKTLYYINELFVFATIGRDEMRVMNLFVLNTTGDHAHRLSSKLRRWPLTKKYKNIY